jgi:hypothetical protein
MSIAAILLAMGLLTGCCTPLHSDLHAVNLFPQHRDWWCWAATTEMISDYYGHRVQQCDSVNFVHGTAPNCCTGCAGNCPCWGWQWGASIGDIQNNWTHWDFSYQYVSAALSWSVLKKTLSKQTNCRKSPIQAVWWWYDGMGHRTSGHVVNITGYSEIRLTTMNMDLVFYNNPAPMDCSKNVLNQCQQAASGGAAVLATYDSFKVNGNRRWEDSFHSFKYTGP